MKKLFLGMPLFDRRVDYCVAKRFFLAESQNVLVEKFFACSSLLAQAFNKLWCDARCGDYDFFAMLHSDVEPLDAGWIDILLAEMEQHEAAIVSAVVALKNTSGLTSTAIGNVGDPWKRVRLTLTQCSQLPATFSADDVGDETRPLLINTGCMLVDLRRPWIADAVFQINNRIAGESVECEPEDWYLSRQAFEAGETAVYATTKVLSWHHGGARFPSWVTPDDGGKPA
jgi:hypothetical protein